MRIFTEYAVRITDCTSTFHRTKRAFAYVLPVRSHQRGEAAPLPLFQN